MTKAHGIWKVWLLSAVGVGCVLWLADAIVRGSWEISQVAYSQGREDARSIVIDRAPLRMIKDPYPSFSAVAVDSQSNALVVTDENLFQILQYDRRDDTPRTARMTEPKRVISGP